MATDRDYDGEIVPERSGSEERGLVPYREKRTLQKYQPATDAEYRDVTEDDSEETGALTSEQILRMSPTEIEDFRNKRARDFARSLGVPLERAQRMADSEIDLAIEVTDKEKGFASEHQERERAWDEKSKQYKKEIPSESEEDIYEKDESEVRKPEITTETKTEKLSMLERMLGKKPISRTIEGIEKRIDSALEKSKGIPKSEKEIRIERINREKERHLKAIADGKAMIKGGRAPHRELSIKDIGRGDMGAKSFGRREKDSKDFFGMSQFMMGKRTPMGKDKSQIIKPQLPSTYVKPMGNKPPSTTIPFGGNKPPSVSLSSTTLKAKLETGRPIYVKSKTSKSKKTRDIKAPSISIPFGTGTAPDVSLNLPKSAPSTMSFGTNKMPALSFGNGGIKNPVADWEVMSKPIKKETKGNKKETKNTKKPKKDSLDFLNIGGF